MGHIVLTISGLADDPAEALDGATPLQAAATPALDQLCSLSEVGRLTCLPDLPEDEPAVGCDRTTFALLGYDPPPGGRAAVELLGAGAMLGPRDSGVRWDLLSAAPAFDPFPAPPTPEQARQLWDDLAPVLRRTDLETRGVLPLRGLSLWSHGPVELHATPPGQLDPTRALDEQKPVGDRAELLGRLIDDAREVLADHPVNRRRAEAGLPPLDVAWPWGFGRAPEAPLFLFRSGLVAQALTSYPPVRGVARAAGLPVARQDTGQGVSASRIIAALDHAAAVYAHLSRVDRAGHEGDPARKAEAIAQLDRELIRPLVEHLTRDKTVRLTILGDFATRCADRRHAARPVPYLDFQPTRRVTGPSRFDEEEAANTGRQRHGAADLRAWLWSR